MKTKPTTSIAGAQQGNWSSVGKPVGLPVGFAIPAMCGRYDEQTRWHVLSGRNVEVDS